MKKKFPQNIQEEMLKVFNDRSDMQKRLDAMINLFSPPKKKKMIYVVEYRLDDYRSIKGVFSTKAKANRFAKKLSKDLAYNEELLILTYNLDEEI